MNSVSILNLLSTAFFLKKKTEKHKYTFLPDDVRFLRGFLHPDSQVQSRPNGSGQVAIVSCILFCRSLAYILRLFYF